MTDTKFTPGPWAWDGDILTAGKSRRHLLYMEEAPGLRNEAAANIHLIAAAPDLYSALTALLNRYRALVHSGDAGFWDPEAEEEVINSRDALAKARGEA